MRPRLLDVLTGRPTDLEAASAASLDDVLEALSVLLSEQEAERYVNADCLEHVGRLLRRRQEPALEQLFESWLVSRPRCSALDIVASFLIGFWARTFPPRESLLDLLVSRLHGCEVDDSALHSTLLALCSTTFSELTSPARARVTHVLEQYLQRSQALGVQHGTELAMQGALERCRSAERTRPAVN